MHCVRVCSPHSEGPTDCIAAAMSMGTSRWPGVGRVAAIQPPLTVMDAAAMGRQVEDANISHHTRGTPGYLGAMGADEGGGGGGPAKVSKSTTGGSIARSTYASCGWMVRNRSSQRKWTRLLTSIDRTACQGQGER